MKFNRARIEYFPESRIYYLSGMTYYLSRTGLSVAVTLEGAILPEQNNPPAKSNRVYIPIEQATYCESPAQLFNLACWKLQSWLKKAESKYWKEGLVVHCRKYRATHNPVLSQVSKHLFDAYGKDWHENKNARALAVDTLSKFGIDIPAELVA